MLFLLVVLEFILVSLLYHLYIGEKRILTVKSRQNRSANPNTNGGQGDDNNQHKQTQCLF